MSATTVLRPAMLIPSTRLLFRPVPRLWRSIQCAYYTAPSSPPGSNSGEGSKGQQRYLQTATVYRPPNVLDAGVPPHSTSTGSTVLSSLTPQNVFPTPPQPPPTPPKPEASATKPALRPSRLRTPRKAAMTLTSTAISQLRNLLDSPEPKLIRVGVKNRGCSGLAYHLEYVDKPGKFDEVVVQDDVKVLIDSKALFSIIGSEMDWVEDKLSARFVFHNPNIKEQCGCGESFMVDN